MFESLADDARTEIGLQMDRRLLHMEHKFKSKIIGVNEELAKVKKDKRMEDRVSGIEDDIAEIRSDIKVKSMTAMIALVAT